MLIRNVSGNVTITAYGEVEQSDSDVIVTGVVQVNAFTLFLIIFWLVLWIAILCISIGTQFQVIPLFSLLVAGLFALSVKQDQNNLYNQIYATLSKPKKKNSETM